MLGVKGSISNTKRFPRFHFVHIDQNSCPAWNPSAKEIHDTRIKKTYFRRSFVLLANDIQYYTHAIQVAGASDSTETILPPPLPIPCFALPRPFMVFLLVHSPSPPPLIAIHSDRSETWYHKAVDVLFHIVDAIDRSEWSFICHASICAEWNGRFEISSNVLDSTSFALTRIHALHETHQHKDWNPR